MDVEAKNMVCHLSLSPCFILFQLFFLSRFSGYGIGSLVAVKAEENLLFDRDAYNAKTEQGAKIADDGVKEAFEN